MRLLNCRTLSLFAVAVFTPLFGWADTYTYNASLSPMSPVEVTENQNATVSFDVPQDFGSFNSINSIQYELSFTGDLLDPGETFVLCNPAGGVCYGKYNGTTDPMDSFFQTWNGDPAFFLGSGIPNGGVVTFQGETFGANSTVNLSGVTLTINGTAATPEPSSAILVLFGIVVAGGVCRWARRPTIVPTVKS